MQFDPTYATQLDYIPTNGTFYSIQGNYPPVPFDPKPQLNLYYDGVASIYWYDDSGLTSGGGFRTADDFPGIPSGTNDIGSSSGPAVEFNLPVYSYTSGDPSYYYYFWLQILCDPSNSLIGQINILNTLPGMYYEVLTNADLNNTGSNSWNSWVTLLATSTNTPAPALSLNLTNLNFRGKIILPNASYITNGLVAYWKMNDASGTNAADSSGNGVTMPLYGSPSWGPGCLILNGINQYGDAGSNALTSLDQSDKTICAWIYKTNSNFSGILDKSLATGTAGWGFWDTGTSLAFYVSNNDGYFPDSLTSAVPQNQWVFTTVTWHGPNNVDFYTNGFLNSATVRTGIEEPSGTAHLQLGNLQIDNTTANFLFGGYMRDVAVYNRALSPAEVGVNFVNSQYQYSNDVAYPDLLYYKMADYNSSNSTSPTFPIFDNSIHGGTTGTYSNTSETWVTNVAGLSNTALHFSGDKGYIETSNSTLFNFSSNLFTINFWVNPYGISNSYTYVLMQNGTPTLNGWYISLNGINKITFGAETNGDNQLTSAAAAQDNTYTMVTVVRNSLTNASIYIDGVLSSSALTTSPAPSTNALRIGSSLMGQNVLDGNIWLVQIWSTNLSDSDVARLYWHQLGGVPWP